MAEPTDKPPNKYAIHEAAREGRTQAVEALLSQNPRLATTTDADSRLSLHWATTSSSLEIIKLLSSLRSFDPDAPDGSGWTSLMIAASLPSNGGLSIIEFLLTKEADVTLQSTSGATALHFAVSKQNLDVVKVLLKSGASARVKDKRSQLPLHRAAAVGSVPIVKLLLESKSPVNASDVDGMTALHHAMSEGHGDVAVELLKAAADSSKVDGDGRTAVMCAPEGATGRGVVSYVKAWAEREGVELG